MRSRPEIKVFFSPANPLPGETLHVRAELESSADTPLDRVVFDLLGTELVLMGKSSWRHEHVCLRAELPGAPLTPGTHPYEALFDLPEGLPPPYRGRCAVICYTLTVRAEIPWWPDREVSCDVRIARAPVDPMEPAPAASVFVSAPGGARSGELYAELSLASATCEPGGELVGTVAFTNVAEVRRPAIALVASERLFPTEGFLQRIEVERWGSVLSEKTPLEGRGVPFRITIPPDVLPGYKGAKSELEWTVEVTTLDLLSERAVLRAPITMLPRTGEEPRAAPAEAPAVGRERRAQSFASVAERLGLAFDKKRDDLRGNIGSIAVRVAVETRPDGTLATVAHLAWPSLGMRLSVARSGLNSLFHLHGVQTGEARFDELFHVKGRFPAQVRALLDADVRALLVAPPDVEVNDEGATLYTPRALVDEDPLAELTEGAMELARAFDAAFARVPLPPRLVAGGEAWRDLAARLGGQLEPGSGAIRGGTLGLDRVEIDVLWADDGGLLSTEVSIPIDARVDLATLSPAARAHATSLEQAAGGRVEITQEAVTLTFDHRSLPAPRALEDALDGLSGLAQSVRHRAGASPFRS